MPARLSRRDLLKGVSSGFGYLAFAGLSSMAAGAGSKDSPLAPKAPHFPARAKRRDLPLHERGAVARRHVRLQARARLGRRQGVGPAGPHPRREADGLALEVPAARPERAVGLRAVPRGRRARRRAVRDPQHAHRPAGPPGGLPDAAHRQLAVHPALARGVDALRPRDRERRPARLHRDQADRAQRRRAELRQRLPAGGLPGDPHRQRGAADRRGPGRQHQEPPARRRGPAAPARPRPGDEPRAARARAGPPRRRGGDRVVRAGLPHAGQAPGRHGPRGRVGGDEGPVRPGRPGDRRLRPPVPAGPALRRGRRALRRADARRLGPAPRPEGRPRPQRPGRRPADRRPADRPAARGACSTTRW